jgi:SAM-dependent methyltransferase
MTACPAPAPVALPGFEGVSAPGTVYRAADYYGTPADAARELVRHLLHRAPPRPGVGWVLEAGIGGGAIAVALADAGYHVRGLDVRPEAVAECNRLGLERLRAGRRGTIEAKLADFETWAGPASCGWGASCIAAVGNPPFWGDGPRLLAWMRRLYTFAPLVMQVLPTRFMHTGEKAAFHREHRADVLFFDDRLPFDGVGGKDECIGWMGPPVDGLGRNYRVGDAL